MTIKEVEKKTDLARSSIRFYEKENLIHPERNESNGYKNYTDQDVENLKKIAYLRTLGISIENIHLIVEHKISLKMVIESQYDRLIHEISDLEQAKSVCEQMMSEKHLSYDDLNIEAFVPDIGEYWKVNKKIFQMDSVGFVYMWSGTIVWGIITVLCILTAVLSYPILPDRIPVQWSGGEVSSTIAKAGIFAYPVICIVIRFLLYPYVYSWLYRKFLCDEYVIDYIVNFMCFVVFSIEIFTILYVLGILTYVWLVVIVDLIVFVGMLIWSKKR